MTIYFDTLLVCKSNSKLLQKIDPRSLMKKTNSELITCKNGTYYFTTINGSMHENIVALSEKYPKETFKAKIWNVDYDSSEIHTIEYKAGEVKSAKMRPNYGYSISDIEKVMGKKLLERVMKVAMKHIKNFDYIDGASINEESKKKKENDIHSSVTVSVQNRDFKIEATKAGLSLIQVNGYIKVKEGSYSTWHLIERENSECVKMVHQMEKNDDKTVEEMYEATPF